MGRVGHIAHDAYVACATYASLRDRGVLFLGVDSEIFNGFFNQLRVDLFVAGQRLQRTDGDEARIDLEELPQRRSPLAAAEAVSAERHDWP